MSFYYTAPKITKRKEHSSVPPLQMDLPLSSNYKDIQVFHWILDLTCDFTQKQFSGSAIFYCHLPRRISPDSESIGYNSEAPIGHSSFSKPPKVNLGTKDDRTDGPSPQTFVLDCHALDVEACYFYSLQQENLSVDILSQKTISQEISSSNQCDQGRQNLRIPPDSITAYFDIFHKLKNDTNGRHINFIVEKSCLKMFIPPEYFPGPEKQELFAVKIIYKTLGKGPSLTWTKDQNSQPCVYTSGHLLNNRSLMPCQDMPQAMSTWHCFISVAATNATLLDLDNVTVLMAGEAKPSIVNDEDGGRVFGYHSSYPMPASTFALAVGTWPEYITSSTQKDRFLGPTVRMFAPSKLKGNKLEKLDIYLPVCFCALQSVLGPYPLQRLDILVVPASFDSLGMMCPHLMLLSQSILLCENTEAENGMFYRVAHELCHTWLGVLTGPRDWTEEWLTEGICCYLEDVVHAKALKWSELEGRERLELRCLLKYKVLKAEISTTSDDLQTLRPNGDDSAASLHNTDTEPCVVKNGLNPQKTLLQVHYLKGFFFLKHIEELSGKEEFLQVLRTFIEINLGQLFSSTDLLEFCFKELPKLRHSDLTVTRLCQEWLDSPGLPQPLLGFAMDNRNSLYKAVQNEVSILKAGARRKRIKRSETKEEVQQAQSNVCLNDQRLVPEQGVLLLDLLVEEDVKLTHPQMHSLRDQLRIDDAGAEVQHSWCELVIQRKALNWSDDVEKFLTQHQAMGVYLYGELMISENARLQTLARRVFESLRPCMAENQKLAVEEMIFPT